MNNEQDYTIRYRNIIISISRLYTSLMDLASTLNKEAKLEPSPARKSGLYCYSNSSRKHALQLKKLLNSDRKEMLALFGTTDLMKIAKLELQ